MYQVVNWFLLPTIYPPGITRWTSKTPYLVQCCFHSNISIHKMGDAPASLVRQVVEFHSPVSDLAALIIIKSCEIRRKSPSFIANQRSITIKIGNQSVWQLSPMWSPFWLVKSHWITVFCSDFNRDVALAKRPICCSCCVWRTFIFTWTPAPRGSERWIVFIYIYIYLGIDM